MLHSYICIYTRLATFAHDRNTISMTKVFADYSIAIVLAAAVLLLSASGCASSSGRCISPVDGIALFDDFNYSGSDPYYTQNQLPDDESFFNPILSGFYSDPSMCTNGEGDYFLVTSTFTYFPGVPIFHSRDLVNWEQIGFVLSRESQLVNMTGQHVSGGIFAPDIKYNPYNKTYYMVTTNVGAGNFFVKTTDPWGEWSDPIMLPEVLGIDPSFFFDEDGRAYIINNDDAPGYKPEYDGHRTLRVIEFDVETDKCIGERRIVVNKGIHPEDKPIWIEGPHMYKIGGKYCIMSAEGGTGDMHSEVFLTGDSPFGPFKPAARNPILTQRHLDPDRDYPITCAGHADLVQTPEGDWWAVCLACRPLDGKFENLGRETFLLPVRWDEDGTPFMTEGEETLPMVLKREGFKPAEGARNGDFSVCDSFDGPQLSFDWHTLRTSAVDLYSLKSEPGCLALKCAPVSASDRATPAMVLRRQQHSRFEAVTTMVFAPEGSEKAGLILFKDEFHYCFAYLGIVDGKSSLCLALNSREGAQTLAAVPYTRNEVALKVSSDGYTFTFEYSTDGRKWLPFGSPIEARMFSTAAAGGFTGTMIGLYATDQTL